MGEREIVIPGMVGCVVRFWAFKLHCSPVITLAIFSRGLHRSTILAIWEKIGLLLFFNRVVRLARALN